LSEIGLYGLTSYYDVTPILQFTITLQSNNLVPEQRYKVRQFITYELIRTLKEDGLGYKKISEKLNSWGIKTERGKTWFPSSVSSLLKRNKERTDRIFTQRLKKFPAKISKFRIKYYPVE
tara:strand:- start:417 stop:776 length:360 start_codon:yes stop_codon:yes gene_type:complete